MNSRSKLFFDPPYSVFLKARYLRLAYPDLARDLGLRPAEVEAQRKYAPFALGKASDRLIKRDLLKPVLIGIFRVAYLIHYADTLAAVAVHRLVQRHRVAYRIERKHDLGALYSQLPCDDLNIRLAPQLGGEPLLDLQNTVGRIANRA